MQRAMAKGLGDQMRRAAKEGRSISGLAQQYQKAAADLRQLEKAAPQILIQQGRAWPKEEVADVLREIGNAINRGLDNLAPLILSRIAQLLDPADVPICRQIIEDEVNRLRQPWSQGVVDYIDVEPAA